MSLILEAKKLLSEYDSQTAVGKFAQSVIDYIEDQQNSYDSSQEIWTLTKVSKNKGATETDYVYEGYFNHKPKVGQSFQFFYGNHVITTSIVQVVNQCIDNEVEIKTLNSTYILKCA